MMDHTFCVLGLYVVLLLFLAKPLGAYIARVTTRKKIGRIERAIYKLCRINSRQEMGWSQYATGLVLFNAFGIFFVFGLQKIQLWLPLNPEHFSNIATDSALNTAVSFVTNTDWQSYAGENAMSYLTQMLGLATQNFLSAASGMVVAIALIRGFARSSIQTIGNVWVDVTRITLYVLLPLSIVYAVFLASQGVIQNFSSYPTLPTVESAHIMQTIPMGPVASTEAIKMLGSNGGGFFNANSAHPYENPTPFSNFIQMLSIFLIPAALCFAFGGMIGDSRQGRTLLTTVTLIFMSLTILLICFEQRGNPLVNHLHVEPSGNMEGKEARFGVVDSAMFTSITTLSSCGATNTMHDSLTPLSGLMTLWNMMLGEVIFGGVGSGLFGILLFAIMAVFISGLMIGRTPEYLGKKIETHDMKMVSLAVLVTPLLVLIGTSIAVVIQGANGVGNPGSHGFSEILYAFTSCAHNNGSAFAGLSANTPFYNYTLAVVMLLGRLGVIVPVLALAGSMVAKKKIATHAGTMPTHGLLFMILLAGVIFLMGTLNYVPALALGPIAEQLMVSSSFSFFR